jgi:hypothetical protein
LVDVLEGALGMLRVSNLSRRSPVAKKKKTAKKKTVNAKSNGKKRLTEAPVGSGASQNEQDPKRRLGNFGGAGEHPRQGGRTSGIVGQTKQRGRTDKKGSKKK